MDVRAYVDRTDEVVTSAPLTSRHTELRLLEPFLDLLGWERSERSVLAEYDLCGRVIDYVFTVEGRPMALLDGRPCGMGLFPGEIETCCAIMARSTIPRGVLTDGETFVLLTRGDDAFDRQVVERESLPERLDDLEPFTAEALRRLAQSAGVESPPKDDGARSGNASTKPGLDDNHDRKGTTRVALASVDRAEGGDGCEDAAEPEAPAPSVPDERAARATTADAARTTGDTQYVVRFFGSRGSVGAVGHSERAQAMKHAVSFLLERGLDPDLPWSPPNDDAIVLDRRPDRRDGSPMIDSIQFEDGRILETGGSDEDVANRVRALAAEIGLRVMFQGEWSHVQ